MSDKQSEGEIVEEEEEEMDESENRKLDFVPTLTDQIHLLKPGFPMPSDPDTESESTLATFSNLTEPETTPAPTHGQASEKETTPAPTHGQASEETTPAPTCSQASEKDVSVESRRQGSAEPESKAAQEPSLHIPSSEPPWIEMVGGGEGGRRGGGVGIVNSSFHTLLHWATVWSFVYMCVCVSEPTLSQTYTLSAVFDVDKTVYDVIYMLGRPNTVPTWHALCDLELQSGAS